jgi:hypothetical protein
MLAKIIELYVQKPICYNLILSYILYGAYVWVHSAKNTLCIWSKSTKKLSGRHVLQAWNVSYQETSGSEVC